MIERGLDLGVNKTLPPNQGVSIGFAPVSQEYLILKGECSVSRGRAEGGVVWDPPVNLVQGDTISFGRYEGAIVFNTGKADLVCRALPKLKPQAK